MAFTAKEKAIAIAPKFTSLMSMMGSGFIILHQIHTQRSSSGARKTNTQHRLLVGMSTCDLLVSFWFFLTTWPIPEEETVYGASGNQASCIAQGFFSQFSIAVAMYNASLSVYYMVKVRYGWRGEDIRRYLEPFLHIVPLVIGIVTSAVGVSLDLHNNDSWECWISPKPMDCNESWKHQGGDRLHARRQRFAVPVDNLLRDFVVCHMSGDRKYVPGVPGGPCHRKGDGAVLCI